METKSKSDLGFWFDFSKNCNFDDHSHVFFAENQDKIFWSALSTRKDIPLDFIDAFRSHMSWVELCKTHNDIEFFKRFRDNIHWSTVIREKKEFLKDPDNIRYFADRMDFTTLSYSTFITNELAIEFEDDVYWPAIKNNTRISPSIKEKYKDRK